MAERRMFSKKIISSAKFTKMPMETQCLYFHLGLNADDDGVVEAYVVMKIIGVNEDHLKTLESKGFIKILDDDLVSYITDWQEHRGIGELAKKRLSYRYRKVRKEALIRDCYTCTCGATKKIMNVHHIKSFSKFKELRYSLDNLITLCPECHKKIHQNEEVTTNE